MTKLTRLGGHVAFFSFISELKDPREYPKSLFLLQGTDTILYIVSAVVIYCYAGPGVTSPALGSASPIIGKIAYGIALPTVYIALTIRMMQLTNEDRSSSAASSTATSLASTSTSASSGKQTACIRRILSPSGPGFLLPSVHGF